MSNLPYTVKFKLPLQYLSVDDWNNFVNDLLFILQYGPGKWLEYYSNGNMSNLNVVRAKTGRFTDLEINGYQALWNLKPVETYTFPVVFENLLNDLQSVISIFNDVLEELQTMKIPVYPIKTIPEAWLSALNQFDKKSVSVSLKAYAGLLIRLTELLTKFKYRLYTAQLETFPTTKTIAGLQATVSGSVNLASLIPSQYINNARFAILRNIGTAPIQINNSIFLMPGDTLRAKVVDITVKSLNEITLTSSQPVPVGLVIGTGLPYPTWAITVQNTQSDPTPAPFQLLLQLNLQGVIPSATLANLLSLLFCQDMFCTKPLYAWIESYSSLSAVNIWVLLPGGIPANSTITIYMAVTNKINYPYTGINAYYSTTYDNGPQVFDAYLNAMGTSIVATSTPEIDSSVYSSIQFTAQSGTTPGYILMLDGQGGSYTAIYISAPNSARLPEVFESVEYYDGSADVQAIIGLADTSSSTFTPGVCGGTHGSAFSWEDSIGAFWDPDDNGFALAGAGDTTLTCSSVSSPFVSNGSAYNFYQLVATSSEAYFNGASLSEPYEVDYSSIESLISYSTSISAYGDIVAAEDSSGGASHTGYLYWFRARAYPPNGVMPSLVSFTQIS